MYEIGPCGKGPKIRTINHEKEGRTIFESK